MRATFPVGQLLMAKEHHPIRSYAGGDGLAVVVTPVGGDFQSVYWVNGDPRTPVRYTPIAVEHTLSWFDPIPDEERGKYLPDGWVMPKCGNIDEMFEQMREDAKTFVPWKGSNNG
jgi:hypothetical protein